MIEFLPWYSSVHRGAGFASQVSTRAYEAARSAVAAFTGARSTDAVIFVRNTTEAINLLTHCLVLRPGHAVLSTIVEHHANMLPWRRLARVEMLDAPESPEQLLAGAAPRSRGSPPSHRHRRHHRREQRHRRGLPHRGDRHARPRARGAARRRRSAARAAPNHRHGRHGRRFPRALGTQDVRAVRRRRADRPVGRARRRRADARRRRRGHLRHRRRRAVGGAAGPA